VAFLVPEVDSLFYINRGMDVIFLVDIFINFFVIFQDFQVRTSGTRKHTFAFWS
jgi:hypothetical protein